MIINIPDTLVENIICSNDVPVGSSEQMGIPVLRLWDDITMCAVLTEPSFSWMIEQARLGKCDIDYEVRFEVGQGYQLSFTDERLAMLFKLRWL